MKNLMFFLFLIFCISFQSCEKSDYIDADEFARDNNVDFQIRSKGLDEWHLAMEKSLQYIELSDNAYILHLSENEAGKIGISNEHYRRIVTELDDANLNIKELMKDPNIHLNIMDPKKFFIQEPCIPRLKTSRETSDGAPSGVIQTNGQEEGSSGMFWLAAKYRKFQVLLQANAAMTPVFTVTTHSLSNYVNSYIGVGGRYSGEAKIYASNMDVWITFRTTDSNGGYCTYKAME